MKIFFAMDLIEGQCVRLVRGDFARKTVYSDDPPAMVEQMKRAGARDFHIIDLDGARTGQAAHRELIRTLRGKIDGYLEVGGGIRSDEDIAFYAACGVSGVIVGTRALTDPLFFEGLSAHRNIVLGLDMSEGRLMVKGWKEAVPLSLDEVLENAARVGIMALLCTNISRDGMLSGADIEGLKRMKSLTKIPVIASGGVASVEDLKKLKEMDLWAAIVGKAFYEGRIRIEEAMDYAD
jgi:phosphoribosylformimino-5-aminoimidazole carboxamide ribotide isomerase